MIEILEMPKEVDDIFVVRITWGNFAGWAFFLAVFIVLLFFSGVWLGSRGDSQAYKQGLLDGHRQATIERFQEGMAPIPQSPRERPALGLDEYVF